MPPPSKIASRIKELVEDAKVLRGIKKKDLAKKMKISATHFSNLLNGDNEWTAPQIEALSEALGMPLPMMFPWDKSEHGDLHRQLEEILQLGDESAVWISGNIIALNEYALRHKAANKEVRALPSKQRQLGR